MASKVFSKRLMQLRVEKGVGQKQMSRALLMADSYIYNIEAGYAYPSMTQFFAICEYLDISPAEFMKFEVEFSSKKEELLETVKDFENEKMDQVITFAKGLKE